jgi:hypothetical protein
LSAANPDVPYRRVPQSCFVAKPCPPSALIEACADLRERFRQLRRRIEASPNPALAACVNLSSVRFRTELFLDRNQAPFKN